MDFLVFFLGALIGLVLGAVLALLMLRRTRLDGPGVEEVTELREQLAGAQAENRLLHSQRQAEEESETARETERESLIEMLIPVRQSLTTMQQQIQTMERERAAQHSALTEQLSTAAKSDQLIIESTRALMGSLHSTTARGHWGEVQLRRVVEAAGMIPHVDFAEQHTGTDVDGAGLRPDMVVHLPGERQLIVDAKAPLAPDDPAAQAKALRARIEELAKKRYWESVDLSPEVVLCFVPAESLLSSALTADPSLLDHAMTRGVSLVSPASLLAALKAVAAAWRQERMAQNAGAVVEASRVLHQRLSTLGGHLDQLGRALNRSVDQYNRLVGSLERSVFPQVQRMRDLEVRAADGEDHTTPDGLAEAEPETTQAPPTRHLDAAVRGLTREELRLSSSDRTPRPPESSTPE